MPRSTMPLPHRLVMAVVLVMLGRSMIDLFEEAYGRGYFDGHADGWNGRETIVGNIRGPREAGNPLNPVRAEEG